MTGSLRRLTAAGREDFRTWLALKDGSPPPSHLLLDEEASDPIAPSISLPSRPFGSRYEFGSALTAALAGLDQSTLRFDGGIWDWLSLHYFDEICPDEPNKGRKVGEMARYSLDMRYDRRVRHLVRTSWTLVRDHGESARFMLSGPLHVHGDIVEQLATRDQVIGSRALIAAVARLWWDEAKGTYRSGINNRDRSKGGTIRRLVSVAEQFRMTYDFDSMQPESILALLPREFNRWQPTAAPLVPRIPPAAPRPKGWLGRLLDSP